MDNAALIVTCDHEPIHIPGFIQPHGLMLAADRDSHGIIAVAGDVETSRKPGPIEMRLIEERMVFHLTIADRGMGRPTSRKGFGSRLMDGLVGQLDGTLTYGDNHPGLRATLSAPVKADHKQPAP